ncbi:hypothetical protein PV721_16295 [Streptomyces sp. MB09-01]|uniref:hypothetical protein n=1 Tax=Streptomyces sp. MB09-01 TaxID=3028666 RepID=UPI0029A7382C|nr:hypothetical protein [Streptomyces sp. MB09-01]MDX3535899.1 hypothetical protein [Streptomyces sp. MB09-01]
MQAVDTGVGSFTVELGLLSGEADGLAAGLAPLLPGVVVGPVLFAEGDGFEEAPGATEDDGPLLAGELTAGGVACAPFAVVPPSWPVRA